MGAMDKRRARLIVVAACFSCALALGPALGSVAHAQGAIVLQYPISARSAGMGETGVADNSDPANLFFNPANVVGPACVYAQGSRWDLNTFADDIWTGGGSAGVRLDSGDRMTLGADLAYGRLDYGETIVTSPSGIPLGEYHSFEDYVALTLGAGIRFDDWELRLGGAGKRYDAHYGPAEVSMQTEAFEFDAFAFDIGATLVRPCPVGEWAVTPALAVALVNFGSDIETPVGDDPLPTRFHFGTSVAIASPTVRILSADVPVIAAVYNVEAIERFHDSYFSWAIGGELVVAQMLFLRAGTTDLDDENRSDYDSRSGWGVGVGFPAGAMRARFDYTKTSADYQDKKLGIAVDWML
jgi:hypothetical protein